MTSQFKYTQDIQAQRDLETKIQAHRAKEFDFGSIPDSQTRTILRQGGIRISAAATVGGMTVSELDTVLDNYFRKYPSATQTSTSMGVKMVLQAAGVLLAGRV